MAEVASEDVAVERVDPDGTRGRECGRAPDQTRFRQVRVDDVRPIASDDSRHRDQASDVRGRIDRAMQRRQSPRRDVQRVDVDLRLVRLHHTMHEERLPAERGKTAVDERHMGRGTADIQPGDDPQDPL